MKAIGADYVNAVSHLTSVLMEVLHCASRPHCCYPRKMEENLGLKNVVVDEVVAIEPSALADVDAECAFEKPYVVGVVEVSTMLHIVDDEDDVLLHFQENEK